LTHDFATMPGFAMTRIAQSLKMPGLFVIRRSIAVGSVLDDLVLILECSKPEEWDGSVRFFPL